MKSVLTFLVPLILITSFPCFAQADVGKEKKKNVLFIVSDDLSTRLGCYGDDLAVSPNMDALSKQGVRFDRAYAQFPVCGPSRVSFMTGLLPTTTGVLENKDSMRSGGKKPVTIASWFKEHGYHTLRIGKVYNKHDNSFEDEWSELLQVDKYKRAKVKESQVIDAGHKHWDLKWEITEGTEDGLPDGAVAKQVVNWLEEKGTSEQPFFLAVGLVKPHAAFTAPEKYYDLHDPAVERYKPTAKGGDTLPPGFIGTASKKREALMSKDDREAMIRAYYACVTYIDAQVGRMLEALDQAGLREDTIVVVFGDHGYSLGDHGVWGKATLINQAVNTPLIISAPGLMAKDAVREEPVELVDLFPTLTDLAGLPTPPDLAGISLRKPPENPEKRVARAIVTRQNDVIRTVYGKDWQLIQMPEAQGSKRILYSLEAPKQPLRNAMGKPEANGVEEELSAYLDN